MDVTLINKSTGAILGTVSQKDFQFLVDNLDTLWMIVDLAKV